MTKQTATAPAPRSCPIGRKAHQRFRPASNGARWRISGVASGLWKPIALRNVTIGSGAASAGGDSIGADLSVNQVFPSTFTLERCTISAGATASGQSVGVKHAYTALATSGSVRLDGNTISAIATLPSYRVSKTTTRLLVKLLQRSTDDEFRFSLSLRDEFGTPLTDQTGEIVIQLGPQGGI